MNGPQPSDAGSVAPAPGERLPGGRRLRRRVGGLVAAGSLTAGLCGLAVVQPGLPGLGQAAPAGATTSASTINPNSVLALGTTPTEAPAAAALPGPVVAIAADADGTGYWTTTAAGLIVAEGKATNDGTLSAIPLDAPIVGIAADPFGSGYWLVASDGGIFAFGSAAYLGSMGGQPLNKPIVGMSATSTGEGYWLVAADGGIFAYGTAAFHGSTGSMTLNKPIVGMATEPDGAGYWLVAADGGIFAFTAPFYGSTGSMTLNAPIVGMATTPSGTGYWLVAADGGVFSFTAPFYGSGVGGPIDAPVVGIASGPTGYWIARGSVAPLTSALGQEELLAQLGYLPLSWTPQGFTWRWAVPTQLSSLWVPGQYNTVLKGAIYAFDSVVGLALTGQMTATETADIVQAASDPSAYADPYGYNYVLVQEHAGQSTGETLTVWHTGAVVAHSLVNTGIATRPTALGSFPVYLRYRTQIMRGINPDGTPYADPVTFVAYFYTSDAVHYFPRGSYGWRQSLGCVELPYTAAALVWNYTTYGTLVTVTPN